MKVENLTRGVIVLTCEILSFGFLIVISCAPVFQCGYIFVNCSGNDHTIAIQVFMCLAFLCICVSIGLEIFSLVSRRMIRRYSGIRLTRLSFVFVSFVWIVLAMLVSTIMLKSWAFLLTLLTNILSAAAALYMYTMHSVTDLATVFNSSDMSTGSISEEVQSSQNELHHSDIAISNKADITDNSKSLPINSIAADNAATDAVTVKND